MRILIMLTHHHNKMSILMLCRNMCLLLLSVCCLSSVVYSESSPWGYGETDGPSHWSESYPICAESKQSPIDIDTGTLQAKDIPEVEFTNYEQTTNRLEMVNDGHALKVNVLGGDQMISGGGFPSNRYQLQQFHFHVGDSVHQGSEHTINGLEYPLELHFVHYNLDYDTFEAAVPAENGLAVLGIMFEISDDGADNPSFATIIENLSAVELPGSEAETIPSFALSTLFPASTATFFRYNGSLTTPPCYESVTWTVFTDTVKISEAQVEAFQALFATEDRSEHLVNNYRHVQPLNGRNVLTNDKGLVNSGQPLRLGGGAVILLAMFNLLQRLS